MSGPIPLVAAMLEAFSSSLLSLAAEIMNVRYGPLPLVLFEFRGQTYCVEETDECGLPIGSDSCKRWALNKLLSKAASVEEL